MRAPTTNPVELDGYGGDETLDRRLGRRPARGRPGANSLVGGAGDDTLVSNGGDDTLVGGSGNDRLPDQPRP